MSPTARIIVALLGGALVGAVIVLVIVFAIDGDDGDEDADATPTPTVTATATQPEATEAPPPTQPAATATQPPPTAAPIGFASPEEALFARVSQEFGVSEIGPCPQELTPDTELGVLCYVERLRTATEVTYLIGIPFSEGVGEVIVSLEPDGSWTAVYVELPPV